MYVDSLRCIKCLRSVEVKDDIDPYLCHVAECPFCGRDFLFDLEDDDDQEDDSS